MSELLVAAIVVLFAGFAHAQSAGPDLTGDQAKTEFQELNKRLIAGDNAIQFVNGSDVAEISDAKTLCRLEGAHFEAAQERGGETYTCWISK